MVLAGKAFFIVALHFPPHFAFEKSTKRFTSVSKCWQDIIKKIGMCCKRMAIYNYYKSGISTHYLIFWNQIDHFHAVQVVDRNDASKVRISLNILDLRSNLFLSFTIAVL